MNKKITSHAKKIQIKIYPVKVHDETLQIFDEGYISANVKQPVKVLN